MTIVDFPGPQRHIWKCNCGGTTHYHYSDGTVECAVCGAIGPEGNWHLPEPSELAESTEEIAVRHFDTWELAHRRALKDAAETDVMGIVVFHEDGRVRTTLNGQPETEEEADWYRRRFKTAMHDIGIGVGD